MRRKTAALHSDRKPSPHVRESRQAARIRVRYRACHGNDFATSGHWPRRVAANAPPTNTIRSGSPNTADEDRRHYQQDPGEPSAREQRHQRKQQIPQVDRIDQPRVGQTDNVGRTREREQEPADTSLTICIGNSLSLKCVKLSAVMTSHQPRLHTSARCDAHGSERTALDPDGRPGRQRPAPAQQCRHHEEHRGAPARTTLPASKAARPSGPSHRKNS